MEKNKYQILVKHNKKTTTISLAGKIIDKM